MSKIYNFCWVLVLLLTACEPSKQDSASEDTPWSRVEAIYFEESDEKAIEAIKDYQKKYPGQHLADSYLFLSMAHRNLFQMEEAINYASKCLEIDPGFSYAKEVRAVNYMRLHDWERADADISALEKTLPDDVSIKVLRASYHEERGDFRKALRIIEAALSADGKNPRLLNFYGFILSQGGAYQEAVPVFERAMALQVEASLLPVLQNNLGFAFFKTGRIEEGTELVKQSIQQDPENAYSYYNLARIYLQTDQKELMCEQLKLAKKYHFTVLYGNLVENMEKLHCSSGGEEKISG